MATILNKEQVANFMETFNLSKEEAEQMVTDSIVNWEYAKDKVYIEMIAENKKEEAKQFPHRCVEDMVAGYRIRILESDGAIASAKVNYDLIEKWGITEDELYKVAIKNTESKNPILVQSFAEMLGLPISPEDDFMRIVTNERQTKGASVILYSNFYDKVREHIGNTCYILPSSIHEVLLLPNKEKYIPHELCNMVREINRDKVSEEEVLSNNIYYCDAINKAIMVKR